MEINFSGKTVYDNFITLTCLSTVNECNKKQNKKKRKTKWEYCSDFQHCNFISHDTESFSISVLQIECFSYHPVMSLHRKTEDQHCHHHNTTQRSECLRAQINQTRFVFSHETNQNKKKKHPNKQIGV